MHLVISVEENKCSKLRLQLKSNWRKAALLECLSLSYAATAPIPQLYSTMQQRCIMFQENTAAVLIKTGA